MAGKMGWILVKSFADKLRGWSRKGKEKGRGEEGE